MLIKKTWNSICLVTKSYNSNDIRNQWIICKNHRRSLMSVQEEALELFKWRQFSMQKIKVSAQLQLGSHYQLGLLCNTDNCCRRCSNLINWVNNLFDLNYPPLLAFNRMTLVWSSVNSFSFRTKIPNSQLSVAVGMQSKVTEILLENGWKWGKISLSSAAYPASAHTENEKTNATVHIKMQ